MTDARSEKLKEYSGDDEVVSSFHLKTVLGLDEDYVINARCGIPGIDAACGGFRDGELIAISGPTKNGKTLLAQTFTVGFSKKQNYPLWFTFEVPAKQFLNQFNDLPLIYMPKKLKPRAMDWFEDRVMESFYKYNSRIIFIDHLHYLVDLARIKQTSLEIGTIIRKLKTLAVDNSFVIFLLCHTTKGKHEGTLSYESIRDSSFISQESDSVIMISRNPAIGEKCAEARIEFHRRTGVMERVVPLVKEGWLLMERVEGIYYGD